MLSVAVSHDGRWVVSGSKDRGVQFWDSKTAVVQSMLQGHKNSGESHTSTSCMIALLCTSVSSRFSLVYQPLTPNHSSFFPLFPVISIDLSPAANILATGSGDWQARIWSYN